MSPLVHWPAEAERLERLRAAREPRLVDRGARPTADDRPTSSRTGCAPRRRDRHADPARRRSRTGVAELGRGARSTTASCGSGPDSWCCRRSRPASPRRCSSGMNAVVGRETLAAPRAGPTAQPTGRNVLDVHMAKLRRLSRTPASTSAPCTVAATSCTSWRSTSERHRRRERHRRPRRHRRRAPRGEDRRGDRRADRHPGGHRRDRRRHHRRAVGARPREPTSHARGARRARRDPAAARGRARAEPRRPPLGREVVAHVATIGVVRPRRARASASALGVRRVGQHLALRRRRARGDERRDHRAGRSATSARSRVSRHAPCSAPRSPTTSWGSCC